MKKIKMAAALIVAAFAVGCASTPVSPTANRAGSVPPSQEKVAVNGVVDIGPKMSPQEVATKLIKGKTTLDEVQSLLGQPQNISMLPTSGRMVVYSWRKELQGPPSMSRGQILTMSLPGPLALFSLNESRKKVAEAKAQVGAIRDSYKSLTMIFDPSGILKDFQFNPPLLAVTGNPPTPTLVSVPPPSQ